MHSFEANQPCELLASDTIGPIMETVGGHRLVVVAVNAFTRFVEARALKSVTAVETNEFLLDLLGRHEAPKCVISDKGSQFVNKLFRSTL